MRTLLIPAPTTAANPVQSFATCRFPSFQAHGMTRFWSQAASAEHTRLLAAAEAASAEAVAALETRLVAAAHGEAVAERAAEREAAALRAGISAARGEFCTKLVSHVEPDHHN